MAHCDNLVLTQTEQTLTMPYPTNLILSTFYKTYKSTNRITDWFLFAPEDLEKVPGAHEAQTAKLVAPAKELIRGVNKVQQQQSVFSTKPEPVQYVPAAHSVQFDDDEAPVASISNSDRY